MRILVLISPNWLGESFFFFKQPTLLQAWLNDGIFGAKANAAITQRSIYRHLTLNNGTAALTSRGWF